MEFLQKSGPLEAISVCNIEAPKIAASISYNSNVLIKRTSLKLRNPQNAPDAWEQKQLEEFQNRFNTGTDITSLEFYEFMKADSGKWFRYMKAISVGEPCLLCHGENIAPPIGAKLQEYYPNDLATGYRVGELRGAFSVKITM